jgi:L-alanine-DL-glutamate epimerase-like enolase superfamily enzyme
MGELAIGSVEAIPVRYSDPNDSGRPRYVTLVRIETEDGAVGWGEGITQPAPEIGLAVKLIIDHGLAPLVVGAEEREVREVAHRMREYGFWAGRGGLLSFAQSAVDIALWDLAGKAAGRPVHALLGGQVQERFQACVSLMWDTEDVEATCARFVDLAQAGFSALKGCWGLRREAAFGMDRDRDTTLVAAIRDAIGPDVTFVADVSPDANWTTSQAIAMAGELQDAGLTWIEDPLAGDDYESLARLREAVSLPVATGEREWTPRGYERLARAGAADIVLIDPGRVEGITGMKLAADYAGAHGVNVVPHSWSSAINSAAAMNVLATCPNVQVFELKETATAVTHDLVDAPFAQRDGWIGVSKRPGLGIEVDDALVRKLAYAA